MFFIYVSCFSRWTTGIEFYRSPPYQVFSPPYQVSSKPDTVSHHAANSACEKVQHWSIGIGSQQRQCSGRCSNVYVLISYVLCLGKLIFLMFNMRVYDVTNSMVAPSRGSRRKNLLDLFQGSTLAGVAPNMPKIVSKSGNPKKQLGKHAVKIWKPRKASRRSFQNLETPTQKASRQNCCQNLDTPKLPKST